MDFSELRFTNRQIIRLASVSPFPISYRITLYLAQESLLLTERVQVGRAWPRLPNLLRTQSQAGVYVASRVELL